MGAIAPTDVKKRMVGMGPWFDAAAALPSPYAYTDSDIVEVIANAPRLFEQMSQFTVNPIQIWTTPDGTNPTATDPVTDAPYPNLILEDPYDYVLSDAREYFRISLRHRPVLQVQRVRVMFGTMTVYNIPPQWYQVKNRVGIFHVVTQFGSLAVASAASGYALMGMGLSDHDYMPNALSVDYVAGLPSNWYDLYEWTALRRCMTEFCALQVYEDIAQLADAGLVSVSTSGASTSDTRTYDRFEGRKKELQDKIDTYCATLSETEMTTAMSFL